MKKITLFLTILLATGLTSQAQNKWIQKADFPYVRAGAVGFSIGTKGYIGTGSDGIARKDFWEYDPINDVWTQEADFAGSARAGAAGFSIGNKGYIGTGSDPFFTDDFWEYDPANNVWKKRADFGGAARDGATGFSIGNKGYIGTGRGNGSILKDFWEYDPSNNSWIQKTDFGGHAISGAVSFSIEDKGYVGTGVFQSYFGDTLHRDFWEYDPAADIWLQKADFGGAPRSSAAGFSIVGKGYLGTGFTSDGDVKDFWEYNPATDIWTQKTDFKGGERSGAVGFSIGDQGYLGTGFSHIPGSWENDFWLYTPGNALCEVPANLSVTTITASSVKLTWNGVPGAEGYKVRYKLAGTSEWTNVNAPANSKTIGSLLPGTKYTWQVRTICQTSPNVLSDWSHKQTFTTGGLKSGVPQEEAALDIYPNPLASSAVISFFMQEDSRVQIELYDVAGKKLQTLLDENASAGNHVIDLNRDRLTAGVYILKLSMNEKETIKKLIIQ